MIEEKDVLPTYKAVDLLHEIANEVRKNKQDRLHDSGWKKIKCNLKNVMIRTKGQRTIMIVFGGEHPIMFSFDDQYSKQKWLRELVVSLGIKPKHQRKNGRGEFYI